MPSLEMVDFSCEGFSLQLAIRTIIDHETHRNIVFYPIFRRAAVAS